MATRSAIGIRLNNGKIKAVYCHYDGYPEGVGKTLLEHYDGKTNATKLISLGDISVLDKSMTKPAGHTFNKPVNGYSVFYGRDRGEKNTKAKIYDSVKDVFNKLGSEYVYVLENNQWMYASEDNQKLRPLIDNMATGGGVGRNVSKYEVEKLSNLAYQLQNVEDSWIAKNHSKFVEMQNEYKKQFKKVYGHSNYENPDDFGKMATGGMVFRNTYDMVAAAKKLSNSENYSVLSDKEDTKYMLVPNEKVSKFEKEGNWMKIGRINSDGNFRRLSSDGNKMATGGEIKELLEEIEFVEKDNISNWESQTEKDEYIKELYKEIDRIKGKAKLNVSKGDTIKTLDGRIFYVENPDYSTDYMWVKMNKNEKSGYSLPKVDVVDVVSTPNKKYAKGGEISAVEDWVGMDYSKQEIEMVLDALEKAHISFPEDTKVENANSIEDETRQTAEMTDDLYNEIEEYCPTLDEKAIKEILWGVIHASKNYETSGSPVTYSNFDMMEGSSNTQDLQVFETKLRILTTNWLNEGFEKEEILEYIEHLLDQI